MTFRPMLAVDHDPDKLVFPCWGSAKLDGLRGLGKTGMLLSRSLKQIPNQWAQSVLGNLSCDGFDGELIAGSPTAPNCMQACTSFFMAQNKSDGDWTYHVFDLHDRDGIGFDHRYDILANRVAKLDPAIARHVVLHEQILLRDMDELLEFEAGKLALGYEGLILRKPDSPYKFGRSTINEGYLLKVKRFVDSEAIVVGFVEEMENTNEKTTNELGRSKRSSHKAGKVGKGTLGSLMLRDLKTGVEFGCGSGFDDALASLIWKTREAVLGRIVTYKSFPIGVKDAPRHPVFKAFRNKKDMS